MKIKLIYSLGLASFLLLAVISCKQKRNVYFVSFNDSIQQAIRSYVNENNIDLDSTIIVTDWVVNPYRTDVYISNSFRSFKDNPHYTPSYYSLISDSIITLVYTGVESSVTRDTQDISSEIEGLLINKHVKLKLDGEYVDHVKTWLYSSCSSNGKLVKSPSRSDLFYIPCRDVLDTVRLETKVTY